MQPWPKVCNGKLMLHLTMEPYLYKYSYPSDADFIWFFYAGMALGTGSAIAHRAMDAVMGPRVVQHETVAAEAAAAAPAPTAHAFGGDACGIHTKAFQDVCCLPTSILPLKFSFVLIHKLFLVLT